MARMIPKVDATQLEHSSEEPVYRALRDGLGDDFCVLHSYPWLRPWRGEGALTEGEADFVILHPAHGMLVLEVKGGDRIRHDGQRWFRDTAQGAKEFRDPFLQARRNMHALLDIVQQRSGGRVKRNDFVYGYAVVFPHLDYEGDPPPQADKAIIISRRNLPFVEQAVMTAFRAWTSDSRELRRDRFVMMLDDCLMPKFRVCRPVGPDIASDVEQLIQLTEIQAQVFEGLYEHDRVLVEGVAGSGKTFLALQRALAFARCGRRTLFVCFNKALALWLRRQVVEDPRTSEYRSLLTVRNFHALALELAEAAELGFETVQNEQFWNETVPDLLEQAVLVLDERGTEVMYDALVVDEAQDFAPKWWYALTQYLLRDRDAPLFAFLDPNQSLWGEVKRPPLPFEKPFRLTMNCRNTRKIAAASASVLKLEPEVFARAPIGIKPRLLRATTMSHQKGLVLQELRRLLEHEAIEPQQVVLIAPSAKAKGSLADVSEAGRVPLVTSVDAWRDGRGVLVTTARSFKGLESDVVLLYDMSEFGRLFRLEDLYVACTRARVMLVAVVVHDSTCRAVLESALAASEAQS